MILLINTTIIICLTCFIMGVTKKTKYVEISYYEDPYMYNQVIIWVFAITLIIVEGFVYGYGDGLNYRQYYSYTPENLMIIWKTQKNPGWVTIQWFFRLFGTNIQIMFIVLAVFFTIANITFIKKYSVDLSFSLLLYFLLDFLNNFNGIRQLTAATILMIAFPWVIEKKYIKYILLVIALSTIHKSVLVIIPLLFVFGGKRWNIGVIGFLLFCIFSTLSPGLINSLIGTFFGEDYGNFHYNIAANIMHVIVAFFPLILGLIYHLTNKENIGENRAMDVLINMQAISFGFTLLATSMAQYSRIGWYMKNSTAVIAPFLIMKVFSYHNAKTIRLIAIVLYIAQFVIIQIIRMPGDMYRTFYLDFSI